MDDFILNGVANGSVANALMATQMNVNSMRPWQGEDGRAYITVVQNGKPTPVPVLNTDATLRKDEWKLLDDAVHKAARSRMKAWADLRSANTYTIPNGMSKMVLETERQSDHSPATVSMDPTRAGKADRPHYDMVGLPLPVIHKDFNFTLRQLMASRNGTTPLDMTMAEWCGRAIAEEAERMTLGLSTGLSYGGYNIRGYTNFEQRLTHVITDPTGMGWVPATLLGEILQMKQKSIEAKHYGPWKCYCSPGWDEYMDDDFSAAKGDLTLRERIAKIQGVSSPETLDFLPDMTILLVQMTSEVCRAVVGLDVTTVQWESHGGLAQYFKVMAILVPQMRADYNGNTGIVHGAVPG